MGNKNQGEGDYEAARRFNKREQDFVKNKLGNKQLADELEADAFGDEEPVETDDPKSNRHQRFDRSNLRQE